VNCGIAQRPNETWSINFVMDALANGRRIKCLTVVDDFTRECLDIVADYGISGGYVARDAPLSKLQRMDPVAASSAYMWPPLPGIGIGACLTSRIRPSEAFSNSMSTVAVKTTPFATVGGAWTWDHPGRPGLIVR
jgi:hypothetical protein